MLRGASEIFGRPRRTCHFCIYCGAKFRNGHCHAKRTFESQIEVDGMGRLFGRCGDTCAIAHTDVPFFVAFPHRTQKHRYRVVSKDLRSGLGRSTKRLCRILAGWHQRGLDWPRLFAIGFTKQSPAGLPYIPLASDPLQTSRGRRRYSSIQIRTLLWLSSFDSNVNSPYSKTVCSRERALK